METVTSPGVANNNPAPAAPSTEPRRPSGPAIAVSGGKGPPSVSEVKSSNVVPVEAVAAMAAEEKTKSLQSLQSVTESIEEAVEVLNEALSRKNTSAVIRHDEQLNRFLVTIRDKNSGEVVREIPDEALLKFARNLEEMRGILFDETS